MKPPSIPDHELLRCIGGGSYGEVWLGRNVVGTLRAVKLVRRATFERAEHFEREFRGIQKFEPISRSHEGFVDVLQIGRNDEAEYFYYVMELADAAQPRVERVSAMDSLSHPMGEGRGEGAQLSTQDPLNYSPKTLRAEQQRHTRLPVSDCVNIGVTLACALAHLHKHGLVHRDIKPSNIIFVGGVPKLADIGLVAEASEARSFVGTVGFIPPEGPGSPQADLYSLGKVLYEISTGKDRLDFPQWPGDLAEQRDTPQLVELNAILLKACQPDPRARYQSATEMHKELELLQRGGSVKRQRAVERRWVIAKKVVFGFSTVVIVTAGAWLLSNKLVWRSPDSTLVKANTKRSSSPEVIRLCKLGGEAEAKGTKESLTEAFELLNRAVALDPGYVPAYLALASAYNTAPDWLLPARQALPEVKRAAMSALQIDPSSGEALMWLGVFKMEFEWDWAGAEADFKRAIQLGPKEAGPHFFYALLLLTTGRLPEARVETELALALAPNDVGILGSMVGLYYAERRLDEALTLALKGRREHTNSFVFRIWLAWIYQQRGNHPQAIDEILAARAADDAPDFMGILGHLYAVSGEQEKARGLLSQLQDVSAHRYVPQYYVALVHVGLGDSNAAIACLQNALLEKSVTLSGTSPPSGIAIDRRLDPLRPDPRFQQLLKKMGLAK